MVRSREYHRCFGVLGCWPFPEFFEMRGVTRARPAPSCAQRLHCSDQKRHALPRKRLKCCQLSAEGRSEGTMIERRNESRYKWGAWQGVGHGHRRGGFLEERHGHPPEPERRSACGDRIAIEYGTRQAHFRIVWVLESGVLDEKLVAVHRLADLPCPWEEALSLVEAGCHL